MADHSCDPALAPHGIYVRGKAIWALPNGLVTRNHRVGSFEPICGAAQAGDSAVVVNCIKNDISPKVFYETNNYGIVLVA